MKSLVIKKYKNLEHLSLTNLADVNLIVGQNNVGKSTLLEAISIFAARGDVNQIKTILDIRGEGINFSRMVEDPIEKEIERFASLYPNRNVNSFFESAIEFEGTRQKDASNAHSTLSIKLVKLIEITEKDESGTERTTRRVLDDRELFEYDDSSLRFGLLSSMDGKGSLYILGNRGARPSTERVMPFEYVRTSQIVNEKNPALFDKIALSALEKEIIRALQIIEPRIDAINFLKDDSYSRGLFGEAGNSRVPMVVFNDSAQRYRLSSMGDGINRILTIILALLNCKDGILLIDEIENGLHYSVQSQLWKIIFDLSQRLNVQVFATTHSEDAIRCFADENHEDRGNFIRLENRNGLIMSIPYNDVEKLKFAISQDINVR